MNSYLVKTTTYMGTNRANIVKADSVKEAINKQMDYMELEDKHGANVVFDVMLMEVIE